jgi:hypothetical protein
MSDIPFVQPKDESSSTLEDCRKLINSIAHRVFRRVRAAGGRNLGREDITSELMVAYCVARDKYDPMTGVPFLAYLRTGLFRHINRVVEHELIEDLNTTVIEFETLAVSDKTVAPSDQTMIEQQFHQALLAGIDDRARLFLELLQSPPRELVEELAAVQSLAARSRERGYARSAPTTITAALVFDFMQADAAERGVINKQITKRLAFLKRRRQ